MHVCVCLCASAHFVLSFRRLILHSFTQTCCMYKDIGVNLNLLVKLPTSSQTYSLQSLSSQISMRNHFQWMKLSLRRTWNLHGHESLV